ncbi:MAG: DUF262 domain-containing protein [Treponema sp.]|jgi:uncharacterized protein with ParB-like and HNH nuclease domain|nr:DUF262 domain-containing protein [Treponema sp.]
MAFDLSNEIKLKSISELLGMNFFIPSYQRGYRWTKQQVNDLLDDICDFKPQKDEWYCLQPLVVKKNKEENEKWEVIDGQQRLTTIFLIIHYFNEMWIGKQKINEPIITYQTRNDSSQFLKYMKVGDDNNVIINDRNIDYQYISSAYQVINNWVIEKKKGKFDENEFQSKFKEKTKIIWYETDPKQDGRDIFSRINMGKIPLTNAELIKALFLNSSNFKLGNSNDEERIRLKQLEIATEWDIIETDLHNDEFWLFINKEENNKETRIEFLFELLVGKSTNTEDNYFTFRKFHEKFTDNTEQNITNNWKEIKRCFQTLQNWFENRELYHKIGFLITLGEDIESLIEQSKTQSKSDFIDFIDDKIKSKFVNIQIDGIEYGSNNGNIRNILLIHNIQTMLNNGKENSRFPFNRYKKEKWDIEHIHAVATEIKDEKDQKEWLKEVINFIGNDREVADNQGKTKTIKADDLKNKINVFNNKQTDFEAISKDIRSYFGDDEINDLSNLALLDTGTNRGYKNAIFPVKRKTIIEKEKAGTFVPICTKNVFMKYYSPKIEQMTFWGEIDRNEYFNDIKTILENYLLKEDKQ